MGIFCMNSKVFMFYTVPQGQLWMRSITILFCTTIYVVRATQWGTASQAERSQVWSPMGSLGFSIDLINPPGRIMAVSSTRPGTKMSKIDVSCGKRWPVLSAHCVPRVLNLWYSFVCTSSFSNGCTSSSSEGCDISTYASSPLLRTEEVRQLAIYIGAMWVSLIVFPHLPVTPCPSLLNMLKIARPEPYNCVS